MPASAPDSLTAASAAHRLASGLAELLVEVEARCLSETCGPGCEIRAAAARVAVNAAALALELARELAEVGA